MRWHSSVRLTIAAAALALVGWPQASAVRSHATSRSAASRVVLLSIDGAADWMVDRLIQEGRARAFDAILRDGTAADAMVSAIPALTATAHATLWTGAPSRLHGVTGNAVSALPEVAHTVLDTRSGFESGSLRAEPIWIAAARAGRRALVLQATGTFPFDQRFPDRLLLFDAYANRRFPHGVVHGTLTDGRHTLSIGGSSLTLQADSPDRLTLRAGGQTVTLTPGRLGQFSEPVTLLTSDSTVRTRFRLLSYEPENGTFILVHGMGAEITSNHPNHLAAFLQRTGPILGEGASVAYSRGFLGPTLAAGGSGEAEAWLAEILAANQEYFEGGLRFAATQPWDLLVSYVPNFDAVAHALVGLVHPDSSLFEPDVAARVWPVIAAAFARTADAYVAEIRERFPDATLLIVSDHGMGGAGRLVLPNIALRDAGLLSLSTDGTIDLTRTSAVFVRAKGNTIYVNSTRWKAGIVPPSGEAGLKRKIAAALLGIRDPQGGAPAIRAVYDVEIDGRALGMGGAGAGDVYFDPHPGYDTGGTATGSAAVIGAGPTGTGYHGAAPWRRDQHAIFYAVGPDVAPGGRLGLVDARDVAPTVASLLGIPAPADATGRPLDLR